jgi:hypothetical protein
MALLWEAACIIFHLMVYWLEGTGLWWIGESLAGILVKEDDYRDLITRQEWRWLFQRLLISSLSAIKILQDIWYRRFFR